MDPRVDETQRLFWEVKYLREQRACRLVTRKLIDMAYLHEARGRELLRGVTPTAGRIGLQRSQPGLRLEARMRPSGCWSKGVVLPGHSRMAEKMSSVSWKNSTRGSLHWF